MECPRHDLLWLFGIHSPGLLLSLVFSSLLRLMGCTSKAVAQTTPLINAGQEHLGQ